MELSNIPSYFIRFVYSSTYKNTQPFDAWQFQWKYVFNSLTTLTVYEGNVNLTSETEKCNLSSVHGIFVVSSTELRKWVTKQIYLNFIYFQKKFSFKSYSCRSETKHHLVTLIIFASKIELITIHPLNWNTEIYNYFLSVWDIS